MITISDAALSFIKTKISSRGKGIGLRIGVKKTGCSGLAYKIEFADAILESDEIINVSDVKILVEKSAAIYLSGLSLDFEKTPLKEGLTFQNPNEKGSCGCGESFTV